MEEISIKHPTVSIIIPCYNHGEYLEKAVSSVLNQTYKDFEIIIIDDGSTDLQTIKILSAFSKPKTKIIRTSNQGPSNARNNGISKSNGKYILPLDADNYIAPSFLQKTVRILENNDDVGIVYTYAETFGSESKKWILPEFSSRKMLMRNLIDACALFRKEDWDVVNGYKSNMVKGWEDWDFWLSILELGRKPYRIPEILFHYRVAKVSRDSSMNIEDRIEMHMQLMRNHKDLYIDNFKSFVILYYRITMSKPYRFFKKIHNLVKSRAYFGK
jgi:glycosyltransferase involved in cell wall biosynthesis